MTQAQKEERRKVKVVFLGDRGVGKSSIITRFITSQFQEHIEATVGVDFMGKNVVYKEKSYRLQLWDTAGQEQYRSLVKGYLRTADVGVFIYDCSNIRSLLAVADWLKMFDEVSDRNAYKMIVGNKCDCQHSMETLKQAKRCLDYKVEGIQEFICSAKKGINISKIFQHILQMDFSQAKNPNLKKIQTKLNQFKKSTIKNCCFD